MYDPVWEHIFSTRAWGRYPGEDLIRFVAREAAAIGKSPLKALEIGCGPGANLTFLAREGIAFDAIDGSSSAVETAKRRLDRESPGWKGRIVVGDFCRLPADFTGYNFALDSEALSCNSFEESRGVISDIHSRLLPGGAFWSRTFAPGTWGVGDGTGENVGEDFWKPYEGPMQGKGACRITPKESIPRLYGDNWDSIRIGEITRHDGNPAQMIREWIIVARKHK